MKKMKEQDEGLRPLLEQVVLQNRNSRSIRKGYSWKLRVIPDTWK